MEFNNIEVTNRDLISRILDELRDGLEPYVVGMFRKKCAGDKKPAFRNVSPEVLEAIPDIDAWLADPKYFN